MAFFFFLRNCILQDTGIVLNLNQDKHLVISSHLLKSWWQSYPIPVLVQAGPGLWKITERNHLLLFCIYLEWASVVYWWGWKEWSMRSVVKVSLGSYLRDWNHPCPFSSVYSTVRLLVKVSLMMHSCCLDLFGDHQNGLLHPNFYTLTPI